MFLMLLKFIEMISYLLEHLIGSIHSMNLRYQAILALVLVLLDFLHSQTRAYHTYQLPSHHLDLYSFVSLSYSASI